jgi:hypothetical protein
MFSLKRSLAGFISVSMIAVFSVFGLTGCGEEDPVEDSSAYLQQAFYNLFGTESVRFKANFDMDLNDSSKGMNLGADLDVTGAYSFLDLEDKGAEITLVAKINDSTQGDFRFDVSIKNAEESLFVKLLDIPEIPNFPTAFLTTVVGPWWQVESESAGGGFSTGGFGTPADQLIGVEREGRELVLASKFFKEIEFEGSESVNGYSAHRYSVQLDEAGLYEYMEAAAKIGGQEVDEDLKFGLLGLASVFGFEGDLWIDGMSGTVVKIDGELELSGADTDEISTVEFDMDLSDLNMPFAVEPPVDYEVFDLGAFFGAFLESGMMGGLDEISSDSTEVNSEVEVEDVVEPEEVVEEIPELQ